MHYYFNVYPLTSVIKKAAKLRPLSEAKNKMVKIFENF